MSDSDFTGASYAGGTQFSPGFPVNRDYEPLYTQCWTVVTGGVNVNFNVNDSLNQIVLRDLESESNNLFEVWVNTTSGTVIWETGDAISLQPQASAISPCVASNSIVVSNECLSVSACDGLEKTPARLQTFVNGTVAAGSCAVSIHNHSAATSAIVLGAPLPPGETVTFGVDRPDTLGAIAYTTNGAELHINTII